MSEPHVYLACRECAACHCHDCVMQEREVKRQAVQSLVEERDELREQVARLGAEVKSWQDETIENWQAWQGCQNVSQKIADLMGSFREERDCLRAALEKYGRHEGWCARSGLEFKLREEDYPCTCGLAESLKGAE